MLRKDLIVAVLLTFCLTVTLFQILPIGSKEFGSQEASPNPENAKGKGIPSVWETIHKLEVQVQSLNKTSAREGYMTSPAYDSGWTHIGLDQDLTLIHNLNSTEVLVYVLGKGPTGVINQNRYGGDGGNGLRWHSLTNTTINVKRLESDKDNWTYVRIMIWKIAEL